MIDDRRQRMNVPVERYIPKRRAHGGGAGRTTGGSLAAVDKCRDEVLGQLDNVIARRMAAFLASPCPAILGQVMRPAVVTGSVVNEWAICQLSSHEVCDVGAVAAHGSVGRRGRSTSTLALAAVLA
jgi:hypothetical protein